MSLEKGHFVFIIADDQNEEKSDDGSVIEAGGCRMVILGIGGIVRPG